LESKASLETLAVFEIVPLAPAETRTVRRKMAVAPLAKEGFVQVTLDVVTEQIQPLGGGSPPVRVVCAGTLSLATAFGAAIGPPLWTVIA
jgi:hypothetical protein